MALTYTQMFTQANDQGFLDRLQMALVHVATNTKMEATPPSALSTNADHEDKLARSILAAPAAWSKSFSLKVAVQLIGNSSLLDETVTTDAALFSAIGAVYDSFLPSLV